MIVLGLDLSSKSGYAVIKDGDLVCHGLLNTDGLSIRGDLPEYHYIQKAKHIASLVKPLSCEFDPDLIIIEQTNLGSNRHDQKGLEFIHFAVLDEFIGQEKIDRVHYVDTSSWRSYLKLKLTPEQKKHNAEVSKKKKKAKDNGLRVHNKKGEGKITWKHLSVNWVNDNYGLDFKVKDNDVADAICLAVFGYRKNTKIEKDTVDLEVDLKVFEE